MNEKEKVKSSFDLVQEQTSKNIDEKMVETNEVLEDLKKEVLKSDTKTPDEEFVDDLVKEANKAEEVFDDMKKELLQEEKGGLQNLRIEDRSSRVNAVGSQILEAKYYAPGETCPEDLFWRIAKVCSIPDVIDRFVEGFVEGKTIPHNLRDYFDPFTDVFDRTVFRRGYRTNKNLNAKDVTTDYWVEEARKYYDVMTELEFMPASPTLMNAGRSGMLSSCFFIRIDDSLENIFQVAKDTAMVLKAGGGVGLDFSAVRPSGCSISTSNGSASGPISYMKIFNSIGDQINQGGVRKAAALAALRVDHPDILEFIDCKKYEGELTNFNISVLVTDAFMEAVEADSTILLNHPKLTTPKTIRAREIWDKLVDSAHRNGEPGIIFNDELNRGDVFKGKYGELGVNPCGELPLLSYGSCNLGAINLNKCFNEEKKDVDWNKLKSLVRLGIQFLDNVVEINNYPLERIEKIATMEKKIGLGTMGLHDLMLMCELPYSSEKSVSFLHKLYSNIRNWAEEKSEELGEKRGIPPSLEEVGIKRRNANILTAQPTGSIALICNQASSGIEPVFKWSYTRKDTTGIRTLEHFMKQKYGDSLPDYAQTALEISAADHVKVQATIQKYIDSSISKTINMPNDATVSEVERAIKLAHSLKCKSVTVYRTGSRKKEVLMEKRDEQTEILEEPKSPIRIRPRFLPGVTFRTNTPGGKAYVTINEDKEGLREVFIHISKAGSEIGSHVESEGRLISYALKHRLPINGLISHLDGQKSTPVWEHGRSVKSVPDAVAKCMYEYIEHWEGFSEFIEEYRTEESTEKKEDRALELSGDLCPECGEVLYMESGCDICKNCSYSTCG
jgi:ribonucleoside-diphosphate reductase alpha chain